MEVLPRPLRHLVVVLGDQLDPEGPGLAGFDAGRDALWMAEVPGEARHVPSHKARIALFLSAMRHFARDQRARGRPLRYLALDEHRHDTLDAALANDIDALAPEAVVLVHPGEYRLRESLRAVVERSGARLLERADSRFLCDLASFAGWAKGRREMRQEHFYRWMRRREGVLLDDAGKPEGGQWNYDADNRASFGRDGPGMLPAPVAFAPDALTREVLDAVEARFGEHPGELAAFDWPVTPAEAAEALDDFIDHRLAAFGRWQDAMWEGEPWLYHSRLSAAMNLGLLSPRRVVDAAVAAHRDGKAPLAAVEGFVRQVLGWREYVRGVYWTRMPGFLDDNALGADQPLPSLYWTGRTHARCLADAVGQTLRLGYAHHIQRLMVTGLFALLLGVRPREVHAWYLAVYVDAVEWVELPNVLGMSQYADGGRMVSKPYCASGRYIQRMSNHCAGCRYDPGKAVGDDACPFTTLYWDFLARHRDRFAGHPRTALQWRNLGRKDPGELAAIRDQAAALRERLAEDSRRWNARAG